MFKKLEEMIFYSNGAGEYSIPLVRLDVMPENTPEELRYLYETVVVDDGLDYVGHPDAVLLKDGSIAVPRYKLRILRFNRFYQRSGK